MIKYIRMAIAFNRMLKLYEINYSLQLRPIPYTWHVSYYGMMGNGQFFAAAHDPVEAINKAYKLMMAERLKDEKSKTS